MAKLISKRVSDLVNDPYQVNLFIEYLTNPSRRRFIKIENMDGNEDKIIIYEVDESGNKKPRPEPEYA